VKSGIRFKHPRVQIVLKAETEILHAGLFGKICG
jgi:hypothetical protein